MSLSGSLLSLVLDEVDFWLAWWSKWLVGDRQWTLFVWLLDQNVDNSLLFLLVGEVDLSLLLGRDGRRLDEDDLVVLLAYSLVDHLLGLDDLIFWWWNMDVDVLLH